jgi:hypothetical protein
LYGIFSTHTSVAIGAAGSQRFTAPGPALYDAIANGACPSQRSSMLRR